MKWYLIRWVAFMVTAITIIFTKGLPGWIWGMILGAVLVAFAIAWQVITAAEQRAKEEKEYEQWVKEMEARANYRIEEF